MAATKTLIYLADLTHTGPIISAAYHPLGVGLIGAYLLRELSGQVEVELFKYPWDLSAALERRTPAIVGFSNYSWNCNLGYRYVEHIKAAHPETVIVFGGPNYGTAGWQTGDFWGRYPLIDFHVVGEGEVAMVKLVEALQQVNFRVDAIKNSGTQLPSCHYTIDGDLVAADLVARIRDLAELPSPYLEGLMDKFFDNVLVPLIHTTRGCPFKCTFCTEGAPYYNKVVKRYDLADEFEYIVRRVRDVPELAISDANFGMYKEDLEKAHQIARLQDKHDWPKFIQVNGGKNQKERLMKVASVLKGRMRVSAALQSTDEAVLKNVKRDNISFGELKDLGSNTQKIDARADLELILGLPGDSLATHTTSVRNGVGSGIATLRIHQLIMLPQTDMNTRETRQTFGIRTRFRLMPRSYGRYALYGEEFDAVESEEICVATDTMSEDDYLECRELDLTIEIAHNGNVFHELAGLCRHAGIDWFDVVFGFHGKRRTLGAKLAGLYDQFREDNLSGRWETREELDAHVARHMDRYLSDTAGTNEMSKAKAMAWFKLQNEIHRALYSEVEARLEAMPELYERIHPFLVQLGYFSWCRKKDLLDTEERPTATFDYDFLDLMENGFEHEPSAHRADHPIEYEFRHSAYQEDLIKGYVHEFGTSIDGLGRILMLAPVQRMFRQAYPAK